MSIILKMCLAIFLALLVSDSVVSAAFGATTELQWPSPNGGFTNPPWEWETTPPTSFDTVCKPDMVCGWKIMDVLPNGDKKLKYYIQNPCMCPRGLSCMINEWRPQSNSYNFKCAPNPLGLTPAPARFFNGDPPKDK